MSGARPETVHERARLLAAEALDAELSPADAAWLSTHLETCAECSSVAAEYVSLRAELRALASPQPPRDLWARTAAALDRVDRAGSRKARRDPLVRRGLIRLGLGAPSLLGSVVAVAIVVIVVGVSFFGELAGGPGPLSPDGATGSAATASAPGAVASQRLVGVSNGKSIWIQAGANGKYVLTDATAACASSSGPSCTIGTESSRTLGTILSSDQVSAAVAPDAQRAVVWTDDKIVILPLQQSSPAAVSMDSVATPPATPSTPPATPSTPPATPSVPPATPTPAITPSPSPRPSATSTATSTVPPATPKPSASPAGTSAPPASATPSAIASPSPQGGVSGAEQAILAGYQILGTPQFSPDGSWLAFTARPVDLSTGPDVFTWQVGEAVAQPVTATHDAVFSAWTGGYLLISRIGAAVQPLPAASTQPASASPASSVSAPPTSSAGSGDSMAPPVPLATPPAASPGVSPTTPAVWSYMVDPTTRQAWQIERPMYLPETDPTGAFIVYWAGSVRFDTASGRWLPDAGSLYFDRWGNVSLSDPVSLLPPAAASSSPAPAGSPAADASAAPSLPAEANVSPPASSAGPSGAGPAATPSGPAAPSAGTTASPSVSAAPAETLPQLLDASADPDAVPAWQIAWDPSGSFLAVWVADASGSAAGRLSLFAVDRANAQVNTDEPLLAAPATSDFQFDGNNLVYTLPPSAGGGKTNLVLVPELPAPASPSPSPVSTPTAPAAGPSSTDRPGR